MSDSYERLKSQYDAIRARRRSSALVRLEGAANRMIDALGGLVIEQTCPECGCIAEHFAGCKIGDAYLALRAALEAQP